MIIRVPETQGNKLKLFLTKLKDFSGEDVLGYISSREISTSGELLMYMNSHLRSRQTIIFIPRHMVEVVSAMIHILKYIQIKS